MKKEILKRLDALERQRIENQKAAERQCFSQCRFADCAGILPWRPKAERVSLAGLCQSTDSFRTLTVFFERLHKRYRLEMQRNFEAAITMPFVDYFQSSTMTAPRRRRSRRQSKKWQTSSRTNGELGLLNWWKK